METLSSILPIIIYFLLIIFLIIGIILGIKLIITVENFNSLVGDVKKKIKVLDSVFDVISMVSNSIESITGKISQWIINAIGKLKIFNKRKEEEDYE